MATDAGTFLLKFESKSNRVKGISFHPRRPWILTSLHNGCIQLWDYRIRTMIDKFEEHEGPVRGVCFHPTQPLFVSGGDDFTIRVWNYKTRKCLFKLLGHMDYIRTVQFHHEAPWILSCSDDQTIRIWNWQSRQSVAALTGHAHYVMCAQFHPRDDLIVSASLDQTVRVWDISGLRKKSTQSHADPASRLEQQQGSDLFGYNEAVVKYVLEGHDRGVNWASFHPTLPLIVSSADDRQIKLWRMNDSRAWEVDTFRGHYNNVSCCIFHPRQEMILSDSEDRTIRVWDIQKRSCLQTFRRENDRFWIIAAHPTQNIFAAGHDGGLAMFKLEKERPAYTVHQSTLFMVRDRFIKSFDLTTGRETSIVALRVRPGGVFAAYRHLRYNAAENSFLVLTDGLDAKTWELYAPKEGRSGDVEPLRGSGTYATFVARNRFCVLDRTGLRICETATGDTKKTVTLPDTTASIDAAFPTPMAGCLLLRVDDKTVLYDVQTKGVLAELQTPRIKQVAWSPNNQYVALLSKETLIICNRQLEQLSSIHETMRLKSAVWDENGVLIYNTGTHLKFTLPNGDNGIVRTLDVPVYLLYIRGNKVFALDREVKMRAMSIDPTEYMFKLALVRRKYADVLRMVKESNLIGQAIIGYLQKKGFPEVALHFVKDEKVRFQLALECGNIDVALQSAKLINERDCWHRLGVEALRQGNHQVVEMAYQQTKNFERLSFLYLITGNTYKLERMRKIAEMRQDTMSRFQNSLYLGDAAERCRLLEETGQLQLAHACAITHGLTEVAAAIRTKLGDAPVPTFPKGARLLSPPQPVLSSNDLNWPLLHVQKAYFDGGGLTSDDKLFAGHLDAAGSLAPNGSGGAAAGADGVDSSAWAGELELKFDDDEAGGARATDDDPLGLGLGGSAGAGATAGGAGGGGQWDIQLEGLDGLDAGLEGPGPGGKGASSSSSASDYKAAPVAAAAPTQAWTRSALPADHVAACSLESAMTLLAQQVGVVNFAPYKSLFAQMYIGARAYQPALPGVGAVPVVLQRERASGPARGGLPALVFGTSLAPLIEQLQAAYMQTSKAPSPEAVAMFQQILLSIPLLVLDNREDIDEAKKLIGLCREYINGLRLELARKDLLTRNEEPARQLELAAYFTHCNMQLVHLMLALQVAMVTAYKLKNYDHAGSFARRLLELNPKPDVATQAKKVAQFAERNTANAVEIRYDERNPFVLCSISMVPIYKGSPSITCPLCSSHFLPAHSGKVCPCCRVAQVGKTGSGIAFTSKRR